MMEIPVDVLLTYGPLGLWTTSLLYERFLNRRDMIKVLEDNTRSNEKVALALNGLSKEIAFMRANMNGKKKK